MLLVLDCGDAASFSALAPIDDGTPVVYSFSFYTHKAFTWQGDPQAPYQVCRPAPEPGPA